MIKVYLCGSSREAKRARMWAEKLTQTGIIEIAHRWFDGAEEWAGQDAKWQEANTLESSAARAMTELNAVAASRIVWVLWPKAQSIGAFVELGAALERKRMLASSELPVAVGKTLAMKILVTGIGFGDSLFTALCDYRELSDGFGFHECVRLANAMKKER